MPVRSNLLSHRGRFLWCLSILSFFSLSILFLSLFFCCLTFTRSLFCLFCMSLCVSFRHCFSLTVSCSKSTRFTCHTLCALCYFWGENLKTGWKKMEGFSFFFWWHLLHHFPSFPLHTHTNTPHSHSVSVLHFLSADRLEVQPDRIMERDRNIECDRNMEPSRILECCRILESDKNMECDRVLESGRRRGM